MLLLASMASLAQSRTITISAHFVSPDQQGHEVSENSMFVFRFGVVNQGPDTIFPNDFVSDEYSCDIVSSDFDNDSTHITVIHQMVLPGDTVVLQDSVWLPTRSPSLRKKTISLIVSPRLVGGQFQGNTAISPEDQFEMKDNLAYWILDLKDPVNISVPELQQQYAMYPNPIVAGGTLKIKGLQHGTVTVHTLLGKTIDGIQAYHTATDTQVKLPYSLARGLYVVRMQHDNTISSQSFVVR